MVLKVLSSDGFTKIPPELTPIWYDCFDKGYVDGNYSLCNDSVHPDEYMQLSFPCASRLHAPVAMLFEC